MIKEKEAVARWLVALGDAVAVFAAYLAAVFLRNQLGPTFSIPGLPAFESLEIRSIIGFNVYIYMLIGALPVWVYMLYLNRLYRSLRTIDFIKLTLRIIKAAAMTLLTVGAFLFILKIHSASRLFFFIFMGLSFIIVTAERTALVAAMHYVRRKGYNFLNILIVGTGRRAAEFIARIKRHPEWGMQIVGAIDDEPGRGVTTVDGVEIIGNLGDIPDILHEKPIDEVAFVIPRSRLSHVEQALHECETEGVVTTFAIDLFDMKIAKAAVSEFDGVPLLQFRTTKISEWQLVVKRIVDLVVSGIILVILAPLFLALAVIIKITSRGPVFFRQERVGLHGRRFILYKFRTMRLGAHDALSRVDDVSEMDTPEFKAMKIKWMTPIGRFMRKFSLDELPQLINVFKGNMSIIGPRPTVPDEVEKYKPWQRRRFSMKPGITCLWQISGRNKIGFEDWMKLDLKYVDTWSVWLDVKIALKTLPVVVFGIGAY